jgi:peptidoglycan-associated lipoprotein
MLVTIALAVGAACGKDAPQAGPPPPPNPFPNATGGGSSGNNPATPPDAPPIPNSDTVRSSPIGAATDNRSLNDINGPNSPLREIYFALDSDEVDEEAKKILAVNAELLKTNRTWVVTVEGHSDERGTAEYNLALGDRRALAAKNYLMSLGISADRLRTVSYGKEFPFDAGHNEAAWAKNRRAHLMVTSK